MSFIICCYFYLINVYHPIRAQSYITPWLLPRMRFWHFFLYKRPLSYLKSGPVSLTLYLLCGFSRVQKYIFHDIFYLLIFPLGPMVPANWSFWVTQSIHTLIVKGHSRNIPVKFDFKWESNMTVNPALRGPIHMKFSMTGKVTLQYRWLLNRGDCMARFDCIIYK